MSETNGWILNRNGGPAALRVGVVGLGYWGPNLVRNLHEVEEAELAWVCDLRPELLAGIRRRYPAIQATTSYEHMLSDPTLDAVAVATPVSSHFTLAAAALRAGKHVFVEKPLAASSAESLELMRIADDHGLVVMPGHTFLYSPPVNAIGSMIERGELGDIYFISTSRVNLGLHQSDVSVAWDLGPHDFSILRYWLGETPTHVSALFRSCVIPGTPDVAFINLEFPSGTVAHVELSWLAPSKLRRTTVVGSEKMVVYDDTSNEPVRIFDSGVNYQDPETFGDFQLSYRTGDIITPKLDTVEPLVEEISDFLGALRDGDRMLRPRDLARNVVGLIVAAERSLHEDGRRVALTHDLALAV